MRSVRISSLVYVFLCVSMWALIPVVSKLGQQGLDNHQFLFWSSLVSFIVCLLCLISKGKLPTLSGYGMKDWIIIAGLGFLGTYLYYILLYLGYARAEGLEVLVLQYSWPMFIVFLSFLLLGEKLTLTRALSIVAGFLGALLIITGGDIILGDDLVVHLLVVLAAFSFALFSVLSKRVSYEPLGLVTSYFLVASCCSFFSMWIFSDIIFPPLAMAPAVLINGSIVNGVSYILWLKALRQADAGYIAPFVFLTPLLSTLYLLLFFDEPWRWIYAVGLILVVLSGSLNAIKVRKGIY